MDFPLQTITPTFTITTAIAFKVHFSVDSKLSEKYLKRSVNHGNVNGVVVL